jgi:hypothetical protein
MKFIHHDLGHVPCGATVVARLKGNAANVQLVDQPNLARYRSGTSYRSVGGHFTRSPATLTVPSAGHWHAVIDLGGRRGSVKASVSVINP